MPGAGQRLVALLEQALVQEEVVPGQYGLAGVGAGQRAPALHGLPGVRAVPAAEPVHLAAYGVDVRERQTDVESVREHVQHPGVRQQMAPGHLVGFERGLERPGPALPVEERAGLLDHGRHREDHIGPFGDL